MERFNKMEHERRNVLGKTEVIMTCRVNIMCSPAIKSVFQMNEMIRGLTFV